MIFKFFVPDIHFHKDTKKKWKSNYPVWNQFDLKSILAYNFISALSLWQPFGIVNTVICWKTYYNIINVHVEKRVINIAIVVVWYSVSPQYLRDVVPSSSPSFKNRDRVIILCLVSVAAVGFTCVVNVSTRSANSVGVHPLVPQLYPVI